MSSDLRFVTTLFMMLTIVLVAGYVFARVFN